MIWLIVVLAVLILALILVAWRDVRNGIDSTRTDMAAMLAESQSLFDGVKKYLNWSIDHGNLNDRHKAKMQEFLTGMQMSQIALPGQVKEAVKEAALEVAEQGSGVIVLPAGSVPKSPGGS